MKINVHVKRNDDITSNFKGHATVVFGDEFVVKGISLVEGTNVKGEKKAFVSMPSYDTGKVYPDDAEVEALRGKPIYRDYVMPVTKEFKEALDAAIIEAYKSGKDTTIEVDGNRPQYKAQMFISDREENKSLAYGSVTVSDVFAISSVNVYEGNKGPFVSMPSYKTNDVKDGRPVYRDYAYGKTDGARSEIRDAVMEAYDKALVLAKEQSVEQKPSLIDNLDSKVTEANNKAAAAPERDTQVKENDGLAR